MTSFGNKEPWMEPMNRFLVSNRPGFKAYIDSICAIPADRPTAVVSPSYAAPIHILGRLPAASREGFPSLPFLLDHARSYANLINIWLDVTSERLNETEEIDGVVRRFHELAVHLHRRTQECFNKAEQAERPNSNFEVKWEELVDSMERSATFYDESSSKPTTPVTETAGPTAVTGPASIAGSHRNSVGFFYSRPSLPRRSTDYGAEADEETPPSSSSANLEQGRVAFTMPRWSDNRDGPGSSKNSSTYSLEYMGSSRNRRSSMSKEGTGKHQFFNFMPAPRRKAKSREARDQSQHSREER